jgi:hypothetical protein
MCVAFADLSGMSKGEVERIWLLFVPWVLCATGAIERHERRWLGAQLATALAVQCLVVTPW